MIMKKTMFLILVALLVGCKAQSPKLEAPVAPYEASAVAADVQKVDITPKVDILFVVDYSLSMGKHQMNLARNIKKFVDEFSKNKLLDFHIGVAPIYDHCHFDADGLCRDKTQPNFLLGHLMPLKNTKGEVDTAGPRFVTKSTPNYLELLYNTLLIGEFGGPQFEEMFIPVLPALSPELAKGPNKDFYRQDAYLIVVFITDGDDSSTDPNLNPVEFADNLIAFKGSRAKLSVVGVIAPSSEKSCVKDPGAAHGPVRMEKFLQYVGADVLSLCNPHFGDALGVIGRNIAAKIPSQVIPLTGIRDSARTKKFRVMFGTQELPVTAWSYDSERSEVTINSDTVLDDSQKDAKLVIDFTSVTTKNLVRHKVKKIN